MSYVTIAEVRDWLAIPDSVDDAELSAVLTSACKAIDSRCHQRFTPDSVATARTFIPTNGRLVRLFPGSVIGNTTGMIVKSDDNDDGTFETTWSASNYTTLPHDGVGNDGTSGWPITALQVVGTSSWWPCSWSGRRTVQVTALWGWAATPDPIKTAATLLTSAWYQRRATATGRGGFDGMFASAVDDDPTIVDLLEPYRRRARAVVA